MTIKQFKWIDRDQAARDLLQLVYHAPRFISLPALELLQAIRSPTIIPNLKEIVFDPEISSWIQTCALRAMAHTPGDFYLPELETQAEKAFAKRTNLTVQNNYTDLNRDDFLEDIPLFVDKHPSNRHWFWEVLAQVQNLDVLSHFLLRSFRYHTYSLEFHELLLERLLKLLDVHPHLLTIATINRLYLDGGDKAKRWLNKHLDLVAETCCIEPFDESVLSVAYRWIDLTQRLLEKAAGFEEQICRYGFDLEKQRAERRHKQKLDLPDFRLSPAYQALDDLYQAAKNGDKTAHDKLRSITMRRHSGIIPVRAVAIHMLGELHEQYDATRALQFVLLSAACDDTSMTPILSEAGEALLKCVSAPGWEAMVVCFLRKRHVDLYFSFIDWIAYLTDRLEGNNVEYSGRRLPNIDRRSWFRALAEISEVDL